jgi:hypothetical protein
MLEIVVEQQQAARKRTTAVLNDAQIPQEAEFIRSIEKQDESNFESIFTLHEDDSQMTEVRPPELSEACSASMVIESERHPVATKVFACTKCDETFTYAYLLAKHQSQHKEFPCDRVRGYIKGAKSFTFKSLKREYHGNTNLPSPNLTNTSSAMCARSHLQA